MDKIRKISILSTNSAIKRLSVGHYEVCLKTIELQIASYTPANDREELLFYPFPLQSCKSFFFWWFWSAYHRDNNKASHSIAMNVVLNSTASKPLTQRYVR